MQEFLLFAKDVKEPLNLEKKSEKVDYFKIKVNK